jgi:hypothetical protein
VLFAKENAQFYRKLRDRLEDFSKSDGRSSAPAAKP